MYAVIMAGGRGERLWPKSTKGKAKHVLTFGTKNVMIQETIRRLKDDLPLENIFLITTRSQFVSLRPYISMIKRSNIILEPEGKDTASAICLASFIIEKRHGDVTMVVLPTDHIIKNSKLFIKDLLLAEKIARSDSGLVMIGIKPKYPSVGYGYIELGRKLSGYYRVKRFNEKPKRAKAEEFYKKKNYLWNSGIFIWKTSSILKAIKRHMPNVYYAIKDTVKTEGRYGYSVQLAHQYSLFKPVSIDFAVIEPTAKNRTEAIYCIKTGIDWVDIGSWSSVEEIYEKDDRGNIVLSSSVLIDVKGSIIIGERGHRIGVIGVKDLIIVETKSGTLVCHKNRAQEVKDLVRSFE